MHVHDRIHDRTHVCVRGHLARLASPSSLGDRFHCGVHIRVRVASRIRTHLSTRERLARIASLGPLGVRFHCGVHIRVRVRLRDLMH